jgi:hypothetical protein
MCFSPEELVIDVRQRQKDENVIKTHTFTVSPIFAETFFKGAQQPFTVF